jgi:TRAP-type C4-dicarboxylate transport system permease small subunit
MPACIKQWHGRLHPALGIMPMERTKKLLDLPINALMWVAVLAGVAMMLHVSADVAARTIFNIPFGGTNEIVSAYYMVAVAYLPWIWIARNDGHIKVDLFTRMMPSGIRRTSETIARIGTIVYIGLFTWQTFIEAFVKYGEGEVWETAFGFVPVWPSRFILPVAGLLMCLYIIIDLVSPQKPATQPAAHGN